MAATEPIALVGFMAAGKSHAARAIASALDEPVRDTDAMISDRLGEPLEDFFEREGEARFREIEEVAVLDALDAGGVVALGGGAVGSERVRVALREATTVWCRVSEGVAWERCKGSSRPLASDRGRFAALYEERQPLYQGVARVVLPRGGYDTPEKAARWIATLRGRPALRMTWARAGEAEYPVVVGAQAGQLLNATGAPQIGRRTFAVVDPRAVASGAVVPAGCEAPIEASGGERAKTLAEAERLLIELAHRGARRDDALLALGGGVVGDLAGFCAAVYQRGIPVIQMPTTLVAQVDSSLGGKTGVDLVEGKNYVGAYHQPAAVFADPKALAGLPEEELAAGMAEVVKTALIAGGDLWERVRALDREALSAPARLGSVILECAETKLTVVAEDERDGGRRAVLNLGHTIGHAIETATGYQRYRHGEAVALGLLAALRLSGVAELREEVASLLASFGLPTTLDPTVEADQIVAATAADKKFTAAGLRIVLVREPGDVEHGFPVGEAELLSAVEDLLA